jgi:hypothetical protein
LPWLFFVMEGWAKLLGNAVFYPVAVPPFDRIYWESLQQNREMQVIAAGQPRRPARPEQIALAHVFAASDGER